MQKRIYVRACLAIAAMALIVGAAQPSVAAGTTDREPTTHEILEAELNAEAGESSSGLSLDDLNSNPSLRSSAKEAELSTEATPGTGDLADLGIEGVDWEPVAPDEMPSDENTDEGGVASRSVIGTDSRYRVTSATGEYSKAVWFRTSHNGINYSTCSGTLIGKNFVLTAAHCLFDTNTRSYYTYGEAFASWTNTGPGIRCAVSNAWTGAAYRSSASRAADWGVAQLSCNAGTTYGTIPMVANDSINYYAGKTVRVSGYPGNIPPEENNVENADGQLWTATGPIGAYSNSSFLAHTVDTTSGQSGSAVVWEGNKIIAIHTTSKDIVFAGQNAAVRITSSLRTTILNIMATPV